MFQPASPLFIAAILFVFWVSCPLLAAPGDPYIGEAPAILALEKKLPRMAGSESRVVITGETGTGKEVIAHRIHAMSLRASKPFVALNCAALPETLAEALLFGAKKGAYTGAYTDTVGLIEAAEGGTLFLDELGEMPLSLQVLLLRALETKKYRRVGETAERSMDIRFIGGTNKDLEKGVEDGTFRKDFYYRLAVFYLEMPPLRERRVDLVPLLKHLAADLERESEHFPKGKTFSEAAIEKMLAYPWPGNIRELRNTIEYASIVSEGMEIQVAELPASIQKYKPKTPVVPVDATMAEVINPMTYAPDGKLLTLMERLDAQCLDALHRVGRFELAAAELDLGVKALRLRIKRARENPRLAPWHGTAPK